MKDVTTILKRPLITEKGTLLKAENNQIVLAVDLNANKIEIMKAVEEVFKVHVENVRTMVIKGKAKRWGRHDYRRSDWKKAIVTLRQGDSIEMYEGV